MGKISLNEKNKSFIKKVSKLKFGGGVNERAIEALYDKVNEIIDSVRKQEGHRSVKSGKEGQIKVKRKAGDQYSLEVRTDRGWASVPITLNTED